MRKKCRMTGEIKNASIQQIHISYNAVEDRLLLKIGFSDNAELAIWLTRRLVKGLWQLLQVDEMAPPALVAPASQTSAQMLESFEKQAAVQKMDFTSEYKQRSTTHQHDILLAKDCHLLKSTDQQTAIELQCNNGHRIKLKLTQELSVALTNMLQLVSKETAWELPLSVHTQVMSAIQTSSALH
jgi:hypothetical protein